MTTSTLTYILVFLSSSSFFYYLLSDEVSLFIPITLIGLTVLSAEIDNLKEVLIDVCNFLDSKEDNKKLKKKK